MSLKDWIIAYYNMEWNARDTGGSNLNWTVSWATLTTDQLWQADRAYSFDWTDDVISLQPITTLDSTIDYTIYIVAKFGAIWASLEAPIFVQRPADLRGIWLQHTFYASTNRIAFRTRFDGWTFATITGSQTVNLDQWYKICVTHRASDKFISTYIDWVSNWTWTGVITSTPVSWFCAFWWNWVVWGTASWFSGAVARWFVWNRILSDQERQQLDISMDAKPQITNDTFIWQSLEF